MAFNLPFGVRVAGNDPLDFDRYIANDITARNALLGSGRAYIGLQVYVLSTSTLYILTALSNTNWEVVVGGTDSFIQYESKVANFSPSTNGRYSLEAALEVDFSAYEGNWYEFLIKDIAITFQWDGQTPPTIPPLELDHYYRVTFVGGVWTMADLSSLGVTVHNDLTGRSDSDAHPIAAVTGLQTALDGKIDEAPNDGLPYIRQSESWEQGLIPYLDRTDEVTRTFDNDWQYDPLANGLMAADNFDWTDNQFFEFGISLFNAGGTDQTAIINSWIGKTIFIFDTTDSSNYVSMINTQLDDLGGGAYGIYGDNDMIFPNGSPANGITMTVGAEALNTYKITSSDSSVDIVSMGLYETNIISQGLRRFNSGFFLPNMTLGPIPTLPVGQRSLDMMWHQTSNKGVSGNFSISAGVDNIVSNSYNAVFGWENTAASASNLIAGRLNTSTSNSQESFIFGNSNIAQNSRQLVGGGSNTINGAYSCSIGEGMTGGNPYSGNFGRGHILNSGFYQLVGGAWGTTVEPDQAFHIGIGTSNILRKDGIIGYKDGTLELPESTNILIDARGNKAVVTKEYGDANYIGGTATGLEALDEGNGIGWRLIGQDPVNFGNIGLGATDLSASPLASTTHGATGAYAFAAGLQSIASGTGSFVAGGAGAEASGSASHAEGASTVASGSGAHAEGNQTTAIGAAAHSEGLQTIALNPTSHAAGSYNIGTDVNTIHETGIGTSPGNRKNAFEIYKTGEVVAPEMANALIDAFPTGRVLITKEYADATYSGGGGPSEWEQPEVYTNVSALNVITPPANPQLYKTCRIRVSGFVSNSLANSRVEINTSFVAPPINFLTGSLIPLSSAQSYPSYASFVLYFNVDLLSNAIAFGGIDSMQLFDAGITWSAGTVDYTIDWSKNLMPDVNFGGVGGGSSTGLEALDQGNGIGWRLVGRDPSYTGAIGLNAVDFSYNTFVNSFFGATGQDSFAVGYQASASGQGSVAIGLSSRASAFGAIALGGEAQGQQSFTQGAGVVEINSDPLDSELSHAEAFSYIYDSALSHAECGGSIDTADYAHAEGSGYIAAGADYAHAEGLETTVSGFAGHAEGSNTLASGALSHAEGGDTIASGDTSHAEGSASEASGLTSHAEGTSTASGDYSHSQNLSTTASGQASHAGGNTSIASGLNAFAHGQSTLATGDNTLAIGNGAEATFTDSIALGNNARSNTVGGVAIGQDSLVNSGSNNVAIGLGVWANETVPQVCIGKYNQNGDNNNVLEVGIGTLVTPKNGLAVRVDGIVTAPSATIAGITATIQPRTLITREYLESVNPFIGSFTTAGRPAASGETTGHYYFDTTLGYPVWVSGSNYVNATGTIV